MKFDEKVNLVLIKNLVYRHENRIENKFGNEYLVLYRHENPWQSKFHFRKMNLVYGGKIDLKVNLLLNK